MKLGENIMTMFPDDTKSVSELYLRNCAMCSSNDLSFVIDGDSQYIKVVCNACGNEGLPSWRFKNCDMDEMSDHEVAAERWNEANE